MPRAGAFAERSEFSQPAGEGMSMSADRSPRPGAARAAERWAQPPSARNPIPAGDGAAPAGRASVRPTELHTGAISEHRDGEGRAHPFPSRMNTLSNFGLVPSRSEEKRPMAEKTANACADAKAIARQARPHRARSATIPAECLAGKPRRGRGLKMRPARQQARSNTAARRARRHSRQIRHRRTLPTRHLFI